MCFLEREVYAFLMSGFAAQCCGPAFFVCGRAAEGDVRGRRWTGRRWIGVMRANCCGQSNTRGATHERRAREGKRAVFFFLRKDRRVFACPSGGSRGRGARLSRPWGIGAAAKNAADCGTGWARDPACRGLRPVAAVPAYPAYRP